MAKDTLAVGRFIRSDLSWYNRATNEQNWDGQVVARNRVVGAVVTLLHLHTAKFAANVLTNGIPLNQYTPEYIDDIQCLLSLANFYLCTTTGGAEQPHVETFKMYLARNLADLATHYGNAVREGRIREDAA